MNSPRLIQTFLPDGTLEGVRIVDLSDSQIKALVIPRIKINDAKKREELKQPALYLLINSENNQLYIGETENFFERRLKGTKIIDDSSWDIAVVVISVANKLGKTDVKYLEHRAVEKAKQTGAMELLNGTHPPVNTVHEFQIHVLEKILEDTAVITELLGYSIFSPNEAASDIWFIKGKKTNVKAQFRGDKFVILAGSIIDKSYAPSWGKAWPKSLAERDEIFNKFGKNLGDSVELVENVPFRSPNHAGGFSLARNVNAWITWKNSEAKTMDEVIRKNDDKKDGETKKES